MRFALLPLLLCLMTSAACHGAHHARRVVLPEGSAPPIGPYSPGIQVGPFLFCSGQIGIDPSTGAMVAGGLQPEARQALENVTAVLEAAGYALSDVVQAQVFLADLNDYAKMNAIYAEFFPSAPPARAAVEVARLPLDARVEIMVTALRH